MRIYRPGATGRQSVFVRPGTEFPSSDFVDANGSPIQFQVVFNNGMAEVDDALGRFMIDRETASRYPFILPRFLGGEKRKAA